MSYITSSLYSVFVDSDEIRSNEHVLGLYPVFISALKQSVDRVGFSEVRSHEIVACV